MDMRIINLFSPFSFLYQHTGATCFSQSNNFALKISPKDITDYIVATTKIMNGDSWIQSMMETLEPKSTNPF